MRAKNRKETVFSFAKENFDKTSLASSDLTRPDIILYHNHYLSLLIFSSLFVTFYISCEPFFAHDDIFEFQHFEENCASQNTPASCTYEKEIV